MSLKLDCGTTPEAIVSPTPSRNALVVGFETVAAVQISNVDMANLVRYWLTNSDLSHEDARVDLITWIATLKIGPGYNPGGRRLVEE